MNWLKTFLKWRWIRFLMVWNRAPIRAQGGILALIPIIVVIISFIYAFYGNRNREFIEYDIQRRFNLVRQYNDLLNLMLDAETGERGYLLTERDEYLEPYRIAVEKIPPAISGLRETINQEYGEKPRLDRLEKLKVVEQLVNAQLKSLKLSQDFVKQNRDREALYNHLKNGKSLMDSIRQNLGEMQSHDGDLLKEKIDEINDIRRRDYIFVFVALLIGLIMRLVSFYLFDRGIVRRINRLTENVGSLIKGEPINNPTPKKDDAIGLLEQEIVKIGKQNNLDTKSD